MVRLHPRHQREKLCFHHLYIRIDPKYRVVDFPRLLLDIRDLVQLESLGGMYCSQEQALAPHITACRLVHLTGLTQITSRPLDGRLDPLSHALVKFERDPIEQTLCGGYQRGFHADFRGTLCNLPVDIRGHERVQGGWHLSPQVPPYLLEREDCYRVAAFAHIVLISKLLASITAILAQAEHFRDLFPDLGR